MKRDQPSLRLALGQLRCALRASASFLLSIELWMMVLMAHLLVGAFWLAFLADWRSLLCFGLVAAYLGARVLLHVRRVVHWPFM